MHEQSACNPSRQDRDLTITLHPLDSVYNRRRFYAGTIERNRFGKCRYILCPQSTEHQWV